MDLHLRRLSAGITSRISHAFLVVITFVLTLTLLPAHAQEKKMVTLTKVPVEKAFHQLSGLYKVRFFYAGSAINKNETITIPPAERSLEQVLQYLTANYRYAFRRSDNMISVSLPRPPATIATQEKTVRGRIGLYENDNIIYNAGVTIRELGSNNAVITDDKGFFSMRLRTNEAVLSISCVGYEPTELEAGDKAQVNVTLKQLLQAIPEVVISTGYQTLARKNTTGAYSLISEKEIERRSSQSLNSVLEGAIPGLTLASGYGRVNGVRQPTGTDIQVRGGSALQTGRNAPLIVVDGFPVNQLPTNMNDVAKIDVLKDAAAAAVWGARAANGVIVIVTKRGKEGKLRVNYASNTYVTSKPDYSKLFRANGADLVDYDKEAYDKGFIDPRNFETSANGYSPSFDLLFQLNKGLLTDAEFKRKQDSLGGISNQQQIKDLLLRTGVRQNHYLSLSGGGKGYNFMVSGTYENGNTVFVGDRAQTAQLNTRGDFQLSPALRFNVDMNAAFDDSKTVPSLSNDIQKLPPYQLLVDGNGQYLYDYSVFNKAQNDRLVKLGYADNGRNLLEEARIANNRNKTFALRTNVGGQWKIVKGLTLNANFLYDRKKQSTKNIIPQQAYSNRNYTNQFTTLDAANKPVYNLPQGDRLDQAENSYNNWAVRTQLNYTRMFGSVHFINLAAGAEVKKYITDGFTVSKFGYNDDLQSWQPIDQKQLLKGGLKWWNGNGVPIFDASSYDRFTYNDIREKSSYGIATYTYDDRYTVTGSYRVDQSNLFGVDPKYRRTPLWSAGVAWDATQESFFNVPQISMLKLRATVGLTGNFDETTTPLLVATRRFQANLNDFAARVASYNPKLRWERTRTINVGVDLGMFNNRFQVTADVYNKYGYDLYGNLVLDPTVGFNQMNINAARMTNKGVEMAIQGNIIDDKNFKWHSRLNIAYNSNRIIDNKVPDGNPEINRPSGTTQYVEGYNRESLWSYQWAGLDDHGNPLVYGDKGEKVKKAVFSSLVHSGTYRAPYSGGFTNIFTYRQWLLSALTTFNFGNVLRREMPNMYAYAFSTSMNYQIRDRWRKPGDEAHTDIASLTPSFDPADFYDGRERVIQYSSNSVIPGDYIRLREVQLGYRLPDALLKRTVLKSVQFMAQMNNIALWKKNKYGIDPEAIDPISGAYYLPEPRVTTFTVRVEL
ncbi:SusC/RagA family TonB-linked outer membrane protein [Chitinophaga arvensicola]|uniref:TonB-linked outer membrane protein, SusC/RagA family n=1 Tax=Chitinophaga arvensicola TaxID=29529 RepID=A0A1I0RG68_9BACT|nr:SusC/RagA family TonB-linked outer membrane protein [Chitinophaga arvensicola]SEW39249.1 TonB-linked outer membrane protein, SusC/RagA family [Chitinophaga arvensicola]